MTAFLHGALTEAPIWVWPLFAALIWFGLRATKRRETNMAAHYVMPFLAAPAMIGLRELASPQLALPLFGAAYLGGVWLGDRYQKGVVLWKAEGRVGVSGEWATFAAVMCVFWMNFAKGVTNAVARDAASGAGYAIVIAVASGALSGQFAGRALRVIRTPEGYGL